jgi:DNA-binding NtrC family response regulator
MRSVARDVRRYAALRAPVLIQGESGTGKDVVARAIHELSRRRGAYVPINVSAFPETLVDAELFGHRRGAFTGALASRSGAFEQADSGTLFLDEIADLAAAVQVKLLRVVEDGTVRPIGGAPTRVDARIVSASWADLPHRCREERFREDLYHRLATFVIRLPPLRDRKSDIAPLCRALLRRIEPELGDKEVTTAALARLVDHHWPGNVRELFSVLYRAAAATAGLAIGAEAIAFMSSSEPCAERPRGPGVAKALLREHGGNVSAAARAAGVARSTFRSWLQRREAS